MIKPWLGIFVVAVIHDANNALILSFMALFVAFIEFIDTRCRK